MAQVRLVAGAVLLAVTALAAVGGFEAQPAVAQEPAVGPMASTASSPAVGAAAGPGGGTWIASSDGAVRSVGGAGTHGDASGLGLAAPIVGMASAPGQNGYWLLGRDGGVFGYGGATFHGSTGNMVLNRPVVGMAAHPRSGYWFVASDGGIFAFGVPFHGSMGGTPLNQPVVGMAATTSGDGYWLVAADGGIFSFGGAGFAGSTGHLRLNQPIVGMAADPDGVGYWFVAADGGVFAFEADFHGSATGRLQPGDRVVAMAAPPSGGYSLITATGAVITFADVTPGGNPTPPPAPPDHVNLDVTVEDVHPWVGNSGVDCGVDEATWDAIGGFGLYWAGLSGTDDGPGDTTATAQWTAIGVPRSPWDGIVVAAQPREVRILEVHLEQQLFGDDQYEPNGRRVDEVRVPAGQRPATDVFECRYTNMWSPADGEGGLGLPSAEWWARSEPDTHPNFGAPTVYWTGRIILHVPGGIPPVDLPDDVEAS